VFFLLVIITTTFGLVRDSSNLFCDAAGGLGAGVIGKVVDRAIKSGVKNSAKAVVRTAKDKNKMNHIFAYLMELEGISTVVLYTKTYFMP
jgi:hypothetical protein